MSEPSSLAIVESFLGKTIASARVCEVDSTFEFDPPTKRLELVFSDGEVLHLWDGNQQCCERRFMTCDDDLDSFRSARLVGVEVLRAPRLPLTDEESRAGFEWHDVQFLHVKTTAGTIVCQTHNVHNGFYSGFELRAANARSP